MKNVFLGLAFMLMGTFAFASNDAVESKEFTTETIITYHTIDDSKEIPNIACSVTVDYYDLFGNYMYTATYTYDVISADTCILIADLY